MSMLPLILEANNISEELGRNILFELKIVPLVGIEGGTTKPGGRSPPPLGPYSRTMHRALGGGLFLMSEVPL